jgi:pyocin large subunit-like protein
MIMGLNVFRATTASFVLLAATALVACDGGASAVRAPKADERAAAADTPPPPLAAESRRDDPREAPVRLVAGKPFWAANRTRTAEENAQRAFERNGEAFGAASVEAYVATAHRFVSDPPKGSESLKRANGDTLIYDPAGNIFAVVSKAGAPRALFKPDDGPAYWDVQKARETRRTAAARDREPATSGD